MISCKWLSVSVSLSLSLFLAFGFCELDTYEYILQSTGSQTHASRTRRVLASGTSRRTRRTVRRIRPPSDLLRNDETILLATLLTVVYHQARTKSTDAAPSRNKFTLFLILCNIKQFQKQRKPTTRSSLSLVAFEAQASRWLRRRLVNSREGERERGRKWNCLVAIKNIIPVLHLDGDRTKAPRGTC